MSVIMKMPARFSIKPVLAISKTEILLEPKIIALGAVAAGSIKAIDALMVAGNMNKSGFTSIETDKPAKTGSSISVVAIFDVSSVKKVMVKAMMAITSKGERELIPLNCSPMYIDSPEVLNAPANAKPPPKSKMIFHGKPLAVSQSMSLDESPDFAGIRNKMIAATMATVPSLMYLGWANKLLHPGMLTAPKFKPDLESHNNAKLRKIIPTTF